MYGIMCSPVSEVAAGGNTPPHSKPTRQIRSRTANPQCHLNLNAGGTEKLRLYSRMKEYIELNELILREARRVVTLCQPMAKGNVSSSYRLTSLALLAENLAAVSLLVSHDYLEQARMIVRNSTEPTIRIFALVKNSDLVFSLLRTEYSDNLKRTKEDFQAEIKISEDLAVIDRRIEQINQKRSSDGTAPIPSQINTRELAEKEGVDALYRTYFRLYSWSVHASATQHEL